MSGGAGAGGGVYLVAAEASGDALGADLIGALRRRAPDLSIRGVGGSAMAQAGVMGDVDLSGLAVLGFVDGIKAYPRVVKAADAVCADIVATAPDAVVLIDSWGFMLRVAQRLRAAAPGMRLIKYIGPQVWATRAGRARTLAGVVDHLICIHDFEPEYYRPFGLDCTVCGHPAIGRHVAGDGVAFRARHRVDADGLVLGLAPGSRPSELRRTAPHIWEAAQMLARDRAGLRFVCVVSPAVRALVEDQARASGLAPLLVHDPGERNAAFAACDVALAASGTVTTEIALQGVPVVTGYRLGWVTWALARSFMFKSPYVSLLNVAVRSEVIPEFIQTRCTAALLAGACGRLLGDAGARLRQKQAQDDALALMGKGGPAAQDIAAETILAQRDRL